MLGHEQEGAFAMSSSLKFRSVPADTGRSDMVRNAPGPSVPNRAVGRRVPKWVFYFIPESKKWPWMIQNQLVPADGLALLFQYIPNPTRLL